MALKQKSVVYPIALLLFAALDASSMALARPAICSVLERQLAAASGGGNPSRYARAAESQGQQIQIARQQARSAGCGGGIFGLFVSSNRPKSCDRIMRTIDRMESNRDALLRKRDTLSGGGFSGSRRAVLASLDLNNCNGARVTNVKADRRLPAAIDRGDGSTLFSRTIDERPAEKRRKESVREKKAIQKVAKADDSRRTKDTYVPMESGGTVRTLCVRTCDGFYFPVSFSTTKGHFSKDAAACTALCPGAEAKLYYHSIPDEEPEQMVDLAGQTYMSSPNAFKYRVNGARSTPGCTCAAAQTEVMSKPAPDELAAATARRLRNPAKFLPFPEARPDWLSDSESMANLRGGLTFNQIGDFLGRPEGTGATASLETPKIRIVGPAFLPARPGDGTLHGEPETTVR